MRKIKIINGSYGHYEQGRLAPKDRQSPPFEVEDAEADRLVKMEVAIYADEAVATPSAPIAEEETSENPPEEEAPEIDAEEADTSLESMTINELRSIAAERGIKLRAGMKKAEIITLLVDSDDEEPSLDAEIPV